MMPSIHASAANGNRAFPGATIAGTLAAPANVQIVLQSQAKQGQGNNAFPSNTSDVSIAWKSVAGATSYNVYRSVDQGTYTLYASGVTAATAASNYTSYVSNSSTIDYQTNCDCVYNDTAATNCVPNPGRAISNADNGTVALGLLNATNHGYTYKVSTVNGAGEGPLSPDSYMIYFAGGKKIMNQPNGVFNGTVNYTDATCPAPSPLGNTVNLKLDTSGANSPYFNPYSGGGACDENLGVKGFNYLNICMYTNQSGLTPDFIPEVAGDTQLIAGGTLHANTYGTPTPNQWITYKLPLSVIMKDTQWGTNLQYYAFYKITFDVYVTGGNYWFEWYFTVS